MILRIIVAVIWGLIVHGVKPIIARTFTEPNRTLASYSVGYLAVLPFAMSMFDHLADIRNSRERFLISYTGSGVAFGAGVLLGYWLDLFHLSKNGG